MWFKTKILGRHRLQRVNSNTWTLISWKVNLRGRVLKVPRRPIVSRREAIGFTYRDPRF